MSQIHDLRKFRYVGPHGRRGLAMAIGLGEFMYGQVLEIDWFKAHKMQKDQLEGPEWEKLEDCCQYKMLSGENCPRPLKPGERFCAFHKHQK